MLALSSMESLPHSVRGTDIFHSVEISGFYVKSILGILKVEKLPYLSIGKRRYLL